jgi:AraC family transcriptional regulator
VDYVARVNCAIDHVVSNLAHPLTLAEVSKAAGFSPFHFHRVFKAFLGETLNQFVKRQRLERALFLMSHAPRRSLTDVALDCGFSSSSEFSRSFKQHYGLPPSVFDIETFRNCRREELDRESGWIASHNWPARGRKSGRLRGKASQSARA